MARRKKEVKEVQEVVEAVEVVVEETTVTVAETPAEPRYKNTLGGTLKIDGVVFPGKGVVSLTEEQTKSKRMAHAIACGVINVVHD